MSFIFLLTIIIGVLILQIYQHSRKIITPSLNNEQSALEEIESTSTPTPKPTPMPTPSPIKEEEKENKPFLTYPDNSITYDEHIFTVLDDLINRKAYIVKIPLEQEINVANSIKVLDVPHNSHADNDENGHFYSYEVDFINQNNILFISLSQMYSNSYLFDLHSSQDEPKLILESHGCAYFPSKNSYIFGISGLICSWHCCSNDYYYYNSEKRTTYHLLDAVTAIYGNGGYGFDGCVDKIFCGINKHDTLMIGTISSKNADYSEPYISQIDEYRIEPNTGEIKIAPLITAKQIPNDIFDVEYKEEENLLYLSNSKWNEINIFDLNSKTFIN